MLRGPPSSSLKNRLEFLCCLYIEFCRLCYLQHSHLFEPIKMSWRCLFSLLPSHTYQGPRRADLGTKTITYELVPTSKAKRDGGWGSCHPNTIRRSYHSSKDETRSNCLYYATESTPLRCVGCVRAKGKFTSVLYAHDPDLATVSRWLHQRDGLGSPAYHRTRKLSQKLGRRPIVSEEQCEMLVLPSRNSARHQTYEAQIEDLQLGCKRRTLQAKPKVCMKGVGATKWHI